MMSLLGKHPNVQGSGLRVFIAGIAVFVCFSVGIGASIAAGSLVTSTKKVGGTYRYGETDYVPLYPGDNFLQLGGPGATRLRHVQFPIGVATDVQVTVAKPEQSKDSRNSTQGGHALVQVGIKADVYGKIRAKLVFSEHPNQAWQARVFRRGTVRQIVAPVSATVGQPVRVRFVGDELGVPVMRTDNAHYASERVLSSENEVQFDVVFRKCETIQLGAWLLHDENVPPQEVASGHAAYREAKGSRFNAIVVKPSENGNCDMPDAKVPKTSAPGDAPSCDGS